MTKSKTKSPEVAAVILCGGKSLRMGVDKWRLQLGNLSLLDHIIGQLVSRCSPVLISSSPQSKAPASMHEDVIRVADEHADCGPLEGIRSSLEHLHPEHEIAFITACDVPFVNLNVIDLLLDRLGGAEAVIPVDGTRRYAMTSILRTSAHEKIKPLITRKQLRVSQIADVLDCVQLPVENLKTADANLDCLQNVNTPNDYQALLARLNLAGDPNVLNRANLNRD